MNNIFVIQYIFIVILRTTLSDVKNLKIMTQEQIQIFRRNKFQKWLLIASGGFLLISLSTFFFTDNKNDLSVKHDYKDIPLSELLQQANSKYEDKQFDQAIPYLEEASNRGNARAQYSLGHMYENGEGLNKDIDKAKEYYHLAANQGHKKAKAALKKLGG